jgi:hypothetical protein
MARSRSDFCWSEQSLDGSCALLVCSPLCRRSLISGNKTAAYCSYGTVYEALTYINAPGIGSSAGAESFTRPECVACATQ